MVTPTGAAIVKTLCKRFSSFPEMKIEKTGYGAGSRDLPGHANVVRITIGEAQSEVVRKTSDETITVLEADKRRVLTVRITPDKPAAVPAP